MRIFTRGEFVKLLSGDFEGNYGQIHKVGDIDNSEHPYIIAIVLPNKMTCFLQVNQRDVLYKEYRQIEFEEGLIFYMKNVKR